LSAKPTPLLHRTETKESEADQAEGGGFGGWCSWDIEIGILREVEVMDPADAQRLDVEASPRHGESDRAHYYSSIHWEKCCPRPVPVRSREARLPRGRLPTKISCRSRRLAAIRQVCCQLYRRRRAIAPRPRRPKPMSDRVVGSGTDATTGSPVTCTLSTRKVSSGKFPSRRSEK
jgi:hypothetical protein